MHKDSDEVLLSICIPSYNRVEQLLKLLSSIDCNSGDIEIVIAEDCSPNRDQITKIVSIFQHSSSYRVKLFLNDFNLGYDANLRNLVELACGQYVMFMGDDDEFLPNSLNCFIGFIRENLDKSYFLRSYTVSHLNGSYEHFNYLDKTQEIVYGPKSVAWLFKRSVTIGGFTIRREDAKSFATSELDGTLLYQVYLMGMVCMLKNSIYYHRPFVLVHQSYKDSQPLFGSSKAEKSRYSPGIISPDNSINFTKSFFQVAEYIDHKLGVDIANEVRLSISKYSYPFLSIQRSSGICKYLKYARRLEKECKLNMSIYYYVYKYSLLFFGERLCDSMIRLIKRQFSYTPNL